ncbi:MAG: ATPase, T2SS/T4P/T4SS family [Deltaproteobacteria bacterium]|nr:ATPase, T2SS/T4P/T4SS family [Deltaproteobacteria bacterium]
MSYTIVITEKGGKPRAEAFDQHELTIGRVQGNDIVLPKGNISKRHSRIVLRDGKFIIVDLKSTNGTYVNGKRISSPQVLKEADKVYIGDFTLTLEGQEGQNGASAPVPTSNAPPPAAPNGKNGPSAPSPIDDDEDGLWGREEDKAVVEDEPMVPPVGRPTPAPMAAAARPEPRAEPKPEPRAPEPKAEPRSEPKPEPRSEPKAEAPPRAERRPEPRAEKREPKPAVRRQDFQIELPPQVALHGRGAVFLSVTKALAGDGGLPPDDETTLDRARSAAEKTLNALAKKFGGANTDGWPLQIAKEVCGTGPLGELLEDSSVVEVFVNGPHQILVRKAPDSSSVGIPLVPVQAFFSSDEAVALVVRRIMHAAGVKFDADHPIAEARLPDGTRINAVHHAAAVKGPLVTISRSSTRNATLDELVAETMLSKNMAEFLELCVRARRNVCVCGGPGAQIGTVMSAMASTIADDERIVVVEQVARLKLSQPHVVTLEPRPLKGGPSAATVRDLVGNALRMRPNRVIVHEVTSGEAHDLFVAMGGRQDGTLFTTYAATTRDCLDRLETLISMAGLDVQSRVVREQIASSLDVIVTVTRFADGSSRVTQISEVTGVEVDLVTTQDLFTFKREGFDDGGAVMGRFQATGTPPRFYEELQRRGDSVNLAIFRD